MNYNIDTIKELSKYWDWERTYNKNDFEGNLIFRRIVSLFLSLDAGNSDKLSEEYSAFRSWPERLVRNTANPHPLLKKGIVKWIKEQI